MKATKKLAEFIHDLSYEDLSADAIAKAKLCLMDWVGVTVGGYAGGRSDMDPMIDSLQPFFGQRQATLITKKRKVDTINAALINGTAGHYLDYDDIQSGMSGHPSVPVIPAALAMGEYRKVDGKRFIAAVAAGFEAECRIGEAINPEHYGSGWHATSTLGCFGAGAAVANMIGLDAKKIVSTLGIAGTQAFGVRQSFGTMCKPFHAGKAASNGLLAAILAEGGFTAPQEILEGVDGFGKIYSTKFDETKIDNLGQPFRIEQVVYKRYASCYFSHATVRCMLEIGKKHNPAFSKVDKIMVKVGPLAIEVAGNPAPQTGLEGKFSLSYCAVLALVKGQALESDFTDELVNDPEIKDLVAKVVTVAEDSFTALESEICIVMSDGPEIKEKTDLISERAVSVAEWESILEAKSANLLRSSYPSGRVQDVITAIRGLEEIDDIGKVADLLS
ncbi:MAG: MmgE/PrpD family protein [Dehalococcoidales bacterium]|nr:MAG: MmgE/PrpD family protein [Dehalococcoidales bacterium]